MESKRKEIVEKIDKFAFNIKNLNRIIAIMSALFIVFCFVVYNRKNAEIREQEAIYNRMLAEFREHQLNIIYSNVTPNNGEVDTSNVKEDPIFSNGTDAIIYAFEQFYNYKTYHIEGHGTITAQAAGQNVELLMNFKNAKYTDGAEFDEVVRKETKTNFGQTDAVQIVYKNNRKYNRKGSNVRNENGKWVADFNSSFADVTQSVTSRQFYIVNKDTIKICRDFSFTRNEQGKIEYYKTTVILDPIKATPGYAKNIQEEGGTTYPEFSLLQISCIIDPNGQLMSYSTIEKMTISKKIVIDITTTTTTETTAIFISKNQNPGIPEPSI